jgi:Uma2 family endonuclease
MATKTLLTLADFQTLPWPEGVRYELDEGELVSMSFPTPYHNIVAGEIYMVLWSFVDDNRLGGVFPSNTGYILSHDKATVRGPDVSFVNADRCRSIDLMRDIEGAPDLAVEVVSPSETAADLHKKTRQYLAAGCQVVWIVYPDSREIEVHDRNTNIHLFSENDTVTANDLLPGFAVKVREFFPEL